MHPRGWLRLKPSRLAEGAGRRARVKIAHQERLMGGSYQEAVLVHVDLLDLVPKMGLENDAGAG
jgi:hypothetical protein